MKKLLAALSHRIYYVWKRNLVSYKRFAIPTFIASMGEPLLYLVAMGIGLGSYMGLIKGMPYLNFLAPGLLVSTAMFAATYECTFGALCADDGGKGLQCADCNAAEGGRSGGR